MARNPARYTNTARLIALAAFACATVVAMVAEADAYPTPAAVSPSWQLKFEPGDLRLFVDPLDGAAYWYVTYEVTNQTGRVHTWAPIFELYTDDGLIQRSGRGVPSRVLEDMLTMLGDPLLETQNVIIGDLRPGRENAKSGLVAWPAINTTVTEMSMFVRGISGENTRVESPLTGETASLWKTLQIDYLLPGEARARRSAPVTVVQQDWIMR
jgi:hypothetical protein